MKIKLAILSFLFLSGCGGGGSIDPTGSTPSGTNPPVVTPPVVTPPVVTPPATPITKIVTGEWIAANGGAGGFTNEESFKNFQYEYEVESNNQTVRFELKSNDLDVQFFLYKANGEKLIVSNKGRSVGVEAVLNAGVYKMVVMAERNGRGKFELSINALKKDIKRLESKTIRSTNGTWGEYGGGGFVRSPKNDFYTFEVTEDNTFVDIELESADTEIGLFVYDTNGEILARPTLTSDRYLYFIKKLNKGKYSIMASSAKRNARGKYQVNVYGKVDKLIEKEYVTSIGEDTWKNGKDEQGWAVEVTENNSLLDVELSSTDYKVKFEIVDSSGKKVGSGNNNSNNVSDIITVQKGKYSIYVSPASQISLIGKYKLIIVGDLK